MSVIIQSQPQYPPRPHSVVWPPAPIETHEQKLRRLAQQREAFRVSQAIDRELAQERALLANKAPQFSLLLLGQAESGKSTTLKAFKSHFTPKAFASELDHWTAVIMLNLLRSVHMILDAMARQDALAFHGSEVEPHLTVTTYIRQLREILLPLFTVEDTLHLRICPDNQPASPTVPSDPTPPGVWTTHRSVSPEVLVHSAQYYKMGPDSAHFQPLTATMKQVIKESHAAIRKYALHMKALWKNETVQAILKAQKISMRELSGFFLDDIDRIAAESYSPSEDDVLKARLKTHGAMEHRITIETGVGSRNKDWLIIDVGGARKQRATWAPFFQHVTAIIFLFPLSTFDQQLEEDSKVNRMEDNMALWREICSNTLLTKVQFILFLNKTDILKAKIKSGTQVNYHITTYKGPNEYQEVVKYVRSNCLKIYKDCSPRGRRNPCSVHLTSAIDRKSMSHVLAQVREHIMNNQLANTKIL
ncbi:G-alpha-domain-containing protein [Sistotremastrum suecicum HHB10207 ss-3]|uniref:G-alpha-domain-containing protein n=1 Tax=Sistotremastrum suecicum HHB10207 ss-3 TaxID=1314776 RepID=A0A166BU04_9AGAM|nr:G-alpha-domain-containing protein [Sistotremastrum suecicum HHB10207 ss-3]